MFIYLSPGDNTAELSRAVLVSDRAMGEAAFEATKDRLFLPPSITDRVSGYYTGLTLGGRGCYHYLRRSGNKGDLSTTTC